MRVKHAHEVVARQGASSLSGRPAAQRVALVLARGLATGLRAAVCAPVWAWLGGALCRAAVQLERWVYRQ